MTSEEKQTAWDALSRIEAILGDGFLDPDAPIPGFGNQEALCAEPADNFHESLSDIEKEVARCFKCRLASSRKNTVFGEGPLKPLVLVIGEGPGQEEDETGRPFAGKAGQLLDRMLIAIHLSREKNTYIGNIVKCRPPLNRDPAPDEQEACMPYLLRQIEILKPKAILALGRIAAQALLGSREGIGKLRGQVYSWNKIPIVATYHPSALLREEALKRPAWEDLKLLNTVLPDA